MTHGSKWLIILAATAAIAGKASQVEGTELSCPNSLSVAVNKDLYKSWAVYSNDPLRLTGADISYVEANEDAILDPSETVRLNDNWWSIVSTFRLPRTWSSTSFNLVCRYGVHAQLSQEIPSTFSECQVIHHGRFNDSTEYEFAATCK